MTAPIVAPPGRPGSTDVTVRPALKINFAAIRNTVFFIAVLAMNYTLGRPSPVDFLFVSSLAFSIFVNQTFRVSFVVLVLLLAAWTAAFYYASAPYLADPNVTDEIFKKTFVVVLGLIAAWVAMGWRERQFHRFFRFYVLSCVIASALGIVGYIAGIEELLWDDRAKGFIDDPNMYGSFLIPAVLCCAYMLHYRLGRGAIYLPAMAWIAVGVLFSFSRAAIVAMIICVAVYLFYLNRTNIWRFFSYVTMAVVAGATLFVTALAVVPDFSDKFFSRATIAESYDSGTGGRYDRYAESIPMILQNPRGLGILQQEEIFSEPIHNIFLSSFLNYGWLGGGAWILLFTLSIGLSLWNYRVSRSPIVILVMFCFLAPVLCASLHEGEHWRHLWLWLGVLWGLNVWNFRGATARRRRPIEVQVVPAGALARAGTG